jgi:hypothetical protein
MSKVRIPSRIPAHYLQALLLRGVVLWAVSRLMAKGLFLFIASSVDRETAAAFTQGNPFVLTGWTLTLTAALVWVDLYRRQEVFLLANLGVIIPHAVLIGTIPAMVMETVWALLR